MDNRDDDVYLRCANLGDAELLRVWDADEDIGYSGGDDDNYDWEYELPRNVPWREILIAEVNNEPIGVIVLIDVLKEESHYWGHEEQSGAWAIDIWIGEAKNRSRGFGSSMMRQGIARCFTNHRASVVLIDPLISNHRAISFYRRLGFVEVGPRRFGDDDCLVMSITA